MSGWKDYSDGVTAQASFQHSDGAHLSDSAYHEAPSAKEVSGNSDVQRYRQAEIRAIHLVTSDCGLPGVHLFDSDGQHDGVLSGSFRVGSDLVQGAVEEALHHPARLLGSIALGAVVGAATVVAAPEVLVAGAMLGGGALGVGIAAGFNPIKDVGDFVHNAGVVADPDAHNNKEIASAHEGVRQGGGVLLDVGAGMAANVYFGASSTVERVIRPAL